MFKRAFYVLTQTFFRIILIIYNRLSIRWESALPDEPKYIVAANHCSNLDPIIVGITFPRRLRYLAKEELFRPFLFGRILRILGAVPVLQSDDVAAAAALKMFFKLLDDGESVVLFPEGTRSPDGQLKPLEGGAALISLHAGVPIIPAFITGSFDAMPSGAAIVKPVKLVIHYGQAIYPTKGKSSKAAREELTMRLYESLSQMERQFGGNK